MMMVNYNDAALNTAKTVLKPAHDLYVSSISTRGMALSLETACFVWALCDTLRPKTIVDLGSGFSSYAIRKWQQETKFDYETMPVVWSVDDDERWLDKARSFCGSQSTSTSNFSTWDSFKQTNQKFDLIIYDLGRMQTRSKNLEVAFSMRSEMGIIIVDDMHKYNYSLEVKSLIERLGLQGHDMKDVTMDAHEGRHCWVVSAMSGSAPAGH